jgi:hypothetical protein
MTDLDAATTTQIANIERKTGTTVDALLDTVAGWALDKHGQILARAKSELGLGHGDANLLAHLHRRRIAPAIPAEVDPVAAALDSIYAGSKASLRATHDRAMARIAELGPFEVAPKKTYLSLRRRTQFATIGPGSRSRLEIGLAMKGVPVTTRVEALAAGAMCSHRAYVDETAELDDDLLDHLRRAREAAG